MAKYIFLIFSVLFLSGCSIVDQSTHDKYNNLDNSVIVSIRQKLPNQRQKDA